MFHKHAPISSARSSLPAHQELLLGPELVSRPRTWLHGPGQVRLRAVLPGGKASHLPAGLGGTGHLGRGLSLPLGHFVWKTGAVTVAALWGPPAPDATEAGEPQRDDGLLPACLG